MIGKEFYVITGIGAIAIAFLFVAIAPGLATSDTSDEADVIMEGPSTEDQPDIVDSFKDWPWPPKDLPRTGTVNLRVAELEGKPHTFNQVKIDEAPWLERGMEGNEKYIGLTDNQVADYYAYYEKAESNTPFFEVLYPDGTVKYVKVVYSEVP